MVVQVRPAEPHEAAALTEIALRSKAHWGYDADFMDACRAELTVTHAQTNGEACLVAEMDGGLVGFGDLKREPEGWMIDNLWIDPPFIGKGVGRLLLDQLLLEARQLGARVVYVVSDPHAEAFYKRHGAERLGEIASGSMPGRMLPLLAFKL